MQPTKRSQFLQAILSDSKSIGDALRDLSIDNATFDRWLRRESFRAALTNAIRAAKVRARLSQCPTRPTAAEEKRASTSKTTAAKTTPTAVPTLRRSLIHPSVSLQSAEAFFREREANRSIAPNSPSAISNSSLPVHAAGPLPPVLGGEG